jgi:type IV pilus assembly protein PilB
MLDTTDFVIAAMLEDGIITQEVLDRASEHAAEHDVPLTEALVEQGAVTWQQLTITRALISECPYCDLACFDIDIRHSKLLPRVAAEKHHAFPLFVLGQVVTVGMTDPLDLTAVDQLRRLLRAEIEPVMCEPGALRDVIARAYSLSTGTEGSGPAEAASAADLLTGDEPIVAAVNQIIAQAIRDGASDVHIGPDENALHLRYRIDGSLQTRQGPPKSAHPGIVQRIKVMASLDLTQTRRPQDGKFRFTLENEPVDIRVSVIPTVHGENVVLRLLSSGAAIKGFRELGMSSAMIDEFKAVVDHPYGITLVTGPTGSGKTTTLYTALKMLNTPDRNVMTIEDPVEIRLAMARQVQVNTEIGMTFASALRAILRQDPDIVLVGEIRDQETAKIAVQAALTGHLVLSTLHTNDASGAVTRLKDLGCPAFAINAALLGVLAQRLAKKVCDGCAAPYAPSPALLRHFGLPETTTGFSRGGGCAKCRKTGFRGRMGVMELLGMTAALQRLIEQEASAARIRQQALDDGMRPMWLDGLDKARLGLTTVEELARIVAVNLDEDLGTPVAGTTATGPTEVRLSA